MNILTGKMGASPAFSGVKYCLAQCLADLLLQVLGVSASGCNLEVGHGEKLFHVGGFELTQPQMGLVWTVAACSFHGNLPNTTETHSCICFDTSTTYQPFTHCFLRPEVAGTVPTAERKWVSLDMYTQTLLVRSNIRSHSKFNGTVGIGPTTRTF